MADESSFDGLAAADRVALEDRLSLLVDEFAGAHPGMREAIRYSLLGGGKRLRPLLCLWTFDLFAEGALAGASRRRAAALDAACAIECIHTYSLIHDDLPCMDDDDYRRGRPSSHRRFGEATAVLAGDALLNMAYEIMTALPRRHDLPTATCVEATAALAGAAGVSGLIAGQCLDLEPPAGADIERVERIHERKTARLFAAAMEVGAILGGAGARARAEVLAAGLFAGRAFQIVDDLLDLEGSRESLGKTPRKDVNRGKPTFPAVAGREVARERAAELVESALAAFPRVRGTRLELLIRFVAGRTS